MLAHVHKMFIAAMFIGLEKEKAIVTQTNSNVN
jgi:hypothetical protein